MFERLSAPKKFRLLEGSHYDQNRQKYEKGAVIETDLPLTEMFIGKFEEMPDGTTVSRPTGQITVPIRKGKRAVEDESALEELTQERVKASEQVLKAHADSEKEEEVFDPSTVETDDEEDEDDTGDLVPGDEEKPKSKSKVKKKARH